jgi:hypothetical protein
MSGGGCVLSESCLCLRAFFLTVWWCARKRAPHVCVMSDGCGDMDNMPHTTRHHAYDSENETGRCGKQDE